MLRGKILKYPTPSSVVYLTTLLTYLWDFILRRICPSTASLHGKTVIVTGGNSGIGKETAQDLAKRGAKVIIACRDMKKAEDAVRDIREKVPGANVLRKKLDLASFSSIKKFAEQVLESEPYIHILINNAGVAGLPKSKTEDGFELHFGVNHLGHFLLTKLLMERIKASAPARIVNVSSILHIYAELDLNDLNMDRNYGPLEAYNNSKLANILFTRELAKKLEGSGVSTYSLHPGAVKTELVSHGGKTVSRFIMILWHTLHPIFMSAYRGAQTTIHCAVDESVEKESGHYYSGCRRIATSTAAMDDKLARGLWDASEKMISKAL